MNPTTNTIAPAPLLPLPGDFAWTKTKIKRKVIGCKKIKNQHWVLIEQVANPIALADLIGWEPPDFIVGAIVRHIIPAVRAHKWHGEIVEIPWGLKEIVAVSWQEQPDFEYVEGAGRFTNRLKTAEYYPVKLLERIG